MEHCWLLVANTSVSLWRSVWCGRGIAVGQLGWHLERRREHNISSNAK